MKARSLLSFLVPVLLIALALGSPAIAALLTLTDGSVLEAEDLRFEQGNARFRVGTATRELPASALRDVSFSGQKTETGVLATDAKDLLNLREQALQTMQAYPDSKMVLVLDEGTYSHRADGTNVSRYRGVMYLAKEEALGQAEVGIGFDPNRDRVRVRHARSLAPDGTVHDLAPDQIKISKGSSGGVFFDQYQQLSFTLPEVEVGSLIDYCYELEEFNPFDKNLFQGHFFFQGGDPVTISILRVRMPKGLPLNFVTPCIPADKAKPVVLDEGEETVYTWKLTDQPPIIDEPYMPAHRDIVPSVAFCIQKDWDYMIKRLKPMFEKRFTLSDAVKRKVDELTQGAATLDEKIARLYLFCQKEIRYISIKGNLASNQVGHPAEETLKNRYGDCTDKGMLLATMLKHLGVDAYPIGILTNGSGRSIRELPIFDDDHCITEVHLDGRIFYLDATATDFRYPYFREDDHDTVANNIMLGKLNPIPLPPPEDNAVQIDRKLTLSADGSVRVDFESTQNGPAESDFRGSARNLKPEEYEKEIRESIAGLTANYTLEVATHSDPLDFSGPFKARSVYTLHQYAPRSGRYLVFEIPSFALRFSEISLEKRTYDIVYSTSRLRTVKISIQLPKGFTVKYLPQPLEIRTPYIEFQMVYDQNGDRIEVTRKLALPKRVVPVAEYASHKENLEKIARSTEERIFLEEIAPKEVAK